MEQRDGINKIYRKSWPIDNLFGSSRFEFTQSQRGIWNDLLDMAKISRVRPGLIAAGQGVPYSHEWLANFLHTPLEELEVAIKFLQETKRIIENGSGIEITNWKRYQPEYDRQKPYRQKNKKQEKTLEQREENEYFNKMAIAKLDFKKEQGRQPTDPELQELSEKVKKKVYG